MTISSENAKFLSWLVNARTNNQLLSLEILNIMRENYAVISESQDYSKITQNLASVSFSLWRAVFLADRKGGREKMLSDTENFLAKLVHDNAISYPQDRALRSWSFIYYEQNARLRLSELMARWPAIFPKPPVPRYRPRSATKRWDRTHSWLATGVDNFKALIQPV